MQNSDGNTTRPRRRLHPQPNAGWSIPLKKLAGLRPAGRKGGKPLLSLALQGGGSFGAFTWGVLDRLLEADSIEFDMISGTSAGAANAVVLANGLATGGPPAARVALDRFWRRASDRASLIPRAVPGRAVAASFLSAAADISTRVASPYQLNPLGINPLRALLAEEIDFQRLQAKPPLRLLIAATRVKDGRPRFFRESELSLDAVVASACLPLLHQAVKIDDDWYWDGAYSSNPPIKQLALDSRARDILLVQITPEQHGEEPRTLLEIARRARQISFNSALWHEVEALNDLVALCHGRYGYRSPVCRKLRNLELHRISAEHMVEGLNEANPLSLEWTFLLRLKEHGRAAASNWLSNRVEQKLQS